MSELVGEFPGFSRIICREDVPVAGLNYTLTADEKVRNAMAKRFDLLAVNELVAKLEVLPWRKFGLRIEGSFNADVVQACVVSLAPVPAALNATFSLRFRPVEPPKEGEREISVNPLDDEDIEPLLEEGFDVAEVIAEQLALALEPYPRAPGAELEADAGLTEVVEKKPNPFEVLKDLKPNGKG